MVEGKKPCFVFLGPPGSGKGTQAGILAMELGRPAISTGEMLRDAVRARSALGARVAEVVASGALVHDELMSDVVRERLQCDDTRNGFFLDGYPRTAAQARDLDSILGETGAELAGVFSVDVPEAELVRRATSRGRNDDRTEIIRHRIDVYRLETEPLIEHYGQRGLLEPIDGHKTIDGVAASIRLALRGLAA